MWSGPVPPYGACTLERLREINKLTDEEKRKKRLYWITGTGTGMANYGEKKLESAYVIDQRIEYFGHHLHLDWSGPFFENYWFAYAFWLKERQNA